MTITQNLARASEYNRAIALIRWEEQHSISVSGAPRLLAKVRESRSGVRLPFGLNPQAHQFKSGRPNRAKVPLTDAHSDGNLLLRILFVIGTLMLFGVMLWRSLPVIWRWL